MQMKRPWESCVMPSYVNWEFLKHKKLNNNKLKQYVPESYICFEKIYMKIHKKQGTHDIGMSL